MGGRPVCLARVRRYLHGGWAITGKAEGFDGVNKYVEDNGARFLTIGKGSYKYGKVEN